MENNERHDRGAYNSGRAPLAGGHFQSSVAPELSSSPISVQSHASPRVSFSSSQPSQTTSPSSSLPTGSPQAHGRRRFSFNVRHNGDQPPDPFGLHLVCDHPDPNGDIIFVHGLGGTSKKSWCWNKDTEYFWPEWLAKEDGLTSHRILTFGYNSDVKGAATNLNVIDFAKALLFQMKTFSDGFGMGDDRVPIGRQPITFVSHSMGGLVVKKAYVLGKYDGDYADMISQTHGIVFLATPHRGAQYARILSNILATAPFLGPSKGYLADLEMHSMALQDINEQFRTLCGDLSLMSFFETLKTSLMGKGLFVEKLLVEKDSAVLGYPREMSDQLNADHHTICKFQSREDGNYRSVKNVLKLWASRLRPSLQRNHESTSNPQNVDLRTRIHAICGVQERAEDDFKIMRSKAMNGTCQWITQKQAFTDWSKGTRPHENDIFWLSGLPARGKSVLASYVIDYLTSLGFGQDCQYHFFSSSHQNKRTTAYCLRSIASQLAYANRDFRERLLTLHEETGISFSSEDQNFSVIWEKVFEGILFKMKLEPLFWILDAVDEADMPTTLMSSLAKIDSQTQIRIFISSRPMAFSLDSPISTYSLSEEDTVEDIRNYVRNAVRPILSTHEHLLREDIIDRILAKAAGSFLWVKLAIETLHDNLHTQNDIEKALTEEVPEGMEYLYDRMVEKIKTQAPRTQLMAERILTWAACCWSPLTIDEIEVALEPEFTGFISLQDTILQICGHFVSIENGKVALIHDTARHYLLNKRSDVPACIEYGAAHEHIAVRCLKHLSNEHWKSAFKSIEHSTSTGNATIVNKDRLLIAEQSHPFLGYATRHWAFHVSKSSLSSKLLPATLKRFLDKYCLSWVEAIALSRNLRHLTHAAQHLKAYTKRRFRKANFQTPETPLTLSRPRDLDAERIQLWAIDFIRVVGKFGPNLVQSPSSVYRLVPPFCPSASMISKAYDLQDSPIKVTGLPSETWDDCLASVSVGKDARANKILATDAYFLTLVNSSGTVVVWFADTCIEARRLDHGEYITLARLNRYRTLLATAGTASYRIWDIAKGRELYRLPRSTFALTMVIAFGSTKSELVVGLDDCSVTCYDLAISQIKWRFDVPHREEFHGCPMIMTISPDLTKLALAWRGRPPLVWDMTDTLSQRPLRCNIRDFHDSLCYPEAILWQVNSDSILVRCHNTKIVEWNLYDDEQRFFDHVKPHEMVLSQDGKLLLTTNSMGTISVWTFPHLSLIYQLITEGDYVRNLAFSPDGQRFYDTRGSDCNVWEPDALVRPDEQDTEDQASSGGSSMGTEPVISHDESGQAQVAALAYGFADKYFCAGREDGTVTIHDAKTGKRLRKLSAHAITSTIISLAWSYSNKYIISGDDSGRIIAKRVELKADNNWGVFPIFDNVRVGEPVHQFVLDEEERLLLISTASTDTVWSLTGKKELCVRRWGSKQSRRWIQHPRERKQLIWIDPVVVQTFEWKSLEKPQTVQSETAEITPAVGAGDRAVNWVALTSNKEYIVYLSTTPGLTTNLHLEFLSTANLEPVQPHSLTSSNMEQLAAQMKRLIGTYQNRIVFLDHDYWLCTWRIDAGLNDVKRHFFLPKDWLSLGTLHMAALNAQGTFFCPKHGDVAIVRGGLRF